MTVQSTEPRRSSQSFAYVARDAKGNKRTGIMTARSAEAAGRRLRSDGLFPVEIEIDDGKAAAKGKSFFAPASGLSARKQADLIARLAKLTERKVPIDRALQVVADGDDKGLASVAAKTRKALREGMPFSKALETQAELRDQATLSLVRGAEVSGDLGQALTTAANLMAQRLMVRRRVITGLLYPSLLMIVAIASLGLIMVAIIPQFRPLVDGRMDLVPPLGRAIFLFSDILVAVWPFVLTGIIALILAVWYFIRTGKGTEFFNTLMRRLPFVGRVVNRNQVMMMLQTLGALLSRGVILSQALRVTVNTAPETGTLKKTLKQTLTMVESGDRLAAAFRATRLLPTSTLEVVRIGEESGDLAEMVTKAAEDLRETADRDLERFLALFQPALIILVGLMIGVSLYALFSAIVSVNSISL